jgi:hypothetical protein
MNTNSNGYTIGYAAVMVIIVAFLLAFVSSVLKPTQDKNVELDKKKQILAALNQRGLEKSDIEPTYEALVKNDLIINADGSVKAEEGGFNEKNDLVVYVCEVEGAKKFVFLANTRDAAGGMRTQLAFDMGLMTGIDYTSEHRQVDLFMNGEYLGMYLVAEKAEVGENRVAIDEVNDVFYEKDNYATTEGIYGFQTENVKEKERGFRIVSPEDEASIEKNKNRIIAAENVLYGENDYFFSRYFDLDSWARMYLLQLYTMNSDSYYGSLYFYYDHDDAKLHACTPWDFDYSFGVSWGKTDFYVDPMLYDVDKIEWIKPMLQHDNFIVATLEAYYEGGVRDVILGMPAMVDAYTEENRASALMNEIINAPNYYPDTVESYDDAIAYLREVCEKRIEFMDQKMEQFAIEVGYDIP